MYARYIMRRTQIYLDPQQADTLARRARARGSTTSHLIREAIESYLAAPESSDDRLSRFRSALDASFGIAPSLPSGEEYVREARSADRARDRDLERRRRA